jgi:hypothetical protein
MSQFFVNGTSSSTLPGNVPTSFVGNTGTAIPVLNVLNVVGSGPLVVTGSGNTLTLSLTTTGFLETLSDDVGTIVTPLANNIQLIGHVNEQGATKFSTIVAGVNVLNINPMSAARWIVDPLGFNGTHTAIQPAINSATAGDTILILPGTYTGNLTLKAGVDLAAFDCDSVEPNVIINGISTFSGAGTVSISGIELQTAGSYALVVSGNQASIVNMYLCKLNCSNFMGCNLSSTSGSSQIFLRYCTGNLGTTGINYYSVTGAGSLSFDYGHFFNSGASTTLPVHSSGTVSHGHSHFDCAIGDTGTGGLTLENCTTSDIVCNSTGTNQLTHCRIVANGSDSGLSVGAGATCSVTMTDINSSATNAITGSGSVVNQGIIFSGTSNKSNVTTQTGGSASGLTQGTNPSAGFLGENFNATGTSVSIPSTTNVVNVCSISPTAGIWDVTCSSTIANSGATTILEIGVSTSSATLSATAGDNAVFTVGFTGGQVSQSIASRRYVFTSTTPVYLVATSTFSTGSSSASGKISATRVG